MITGFIINVNISFIYSSWSQFLAKVIMDAEMSLLAIMIVILFYMELQLSRRKNYDCSGNCIVEIDCFGFCGGPFVEDECGICDGDGVKL